MSPTNISHSCGQTGLGLQPILPSKYNTIIALASERQEVESFWALLFCFVKSRIFDHVTGILSCRHQVLVSCVPPSAKTSLHCQFIFEGRNDEFLKHKILIWIRNPQISLTI